MEATTDNPKAGANRPNRTAPTMTDFTRHLAKAIQEWGTMTIDGVMDAEDTATVSLATLGDLGEYDPIATSRLADLMDVVHGYTLTARTMEQQRKTNHAHDALRRLIALYMDVMERRHLLGSLARAALDFGEDCKAYSLAEYSRKTQQEAAESHEPETMTDNTPKR